MQPVSGGKFCKACSQVVTDFTKMTDAQLIDWMANHRGGCGSFRPDQLNRQLIAPNVRKAPFGMKWLLSLLIMTGCIRDEGSKQPTKPDMERTLGLAAIVEQPIVVDSPMIVGEFIPPEPDSPVAIPSKEALQRELIETQTIVQGGMAWEPEPLIERSDSGFSVVTGEIALGNARSDANPGFRPIPDSIPTPAPEPYRASLWQRLFGRR